MNSIDKSIIVTVPEGMQGESSPPSRMTFVDGLRALAALFVLVAHSDAIWGNISTAGPLSRMMLVLADKGALGVEVFFVVSGFSIAYATRKANFDLAWAKIFLVRRLVRLTPVYVASIIFTISVLYLQQNFGNAEFVDIPSAWELIAHLFYLQELLGYGSVVIIYWTLCMEVQFYVVFAILMVSLTALNKIVFKGDSDFPVRAFAGVAVLSLMRPLSQELVHENFLFTSMWFMFAAGVMAWWVFEGRLSKPIGWGGIAILVSLGVLESSESILAAALTCASLLVCAFSSNLHQWLRSKWIQFLGIISYSLYVIHVPVSIFVKTAQARIFEFSDATNLFIFLVMVSSSVGAAYLLYLGVERPSIKWSRRLKDSNILGA